MDKETEIRRTIKYVSDLINESDRVVTGDTKMDYFEFYKNYREVIEYLNRSNDKINDTVPELVKPNIFNRRLGGLWTITILGLLNPFFAILIFTITLPVSIPYVFIRGAILRRTKNRIAEAKIFLTRIINGLKEQKVEMSSR
jgi:hypothetical protein